ncbi:MAG: hypothetical protein ACRD59_12185 [Candidatus Acidiferrales bacterium]
MIARRKKSKKPSAGSERSRPPLDDFVFYLDENLCNSTAIQEALTRSGIRFERHLSYFSRGTVDEIWLPFVGKKGWVLLTTDKQMRYNLLEKRALEETQVREFVFASGNLSGSEMAGALELAVRKIQRMCRRYRPPFVAAITKAGDVHLRWPKR